MPKFGNQGSGTNYQYSSFFALSLLCNAQGFPIPNFRYIWKQIWTCYLEPISGSVPKFGNEGTGTNYYHKSFSDISLLCNAQGFPYPEFRFVLLSSRGDMII